MVALEIERVEAAEAKKRQVRKPADSVPEFVPEQIKERGEDALMPIRFAYTLLTRKSRR